MGGEMLTAKQVSAEFLSEADIAHLTGIKRGRNGKAHEQLQIEQLRTMGIAFRVNARGAPIVTWEAVNGNQKQSVTKWQPAALRTGT